MRAIVAGSLLLALFAGCSFQGKASLDAPPEHDAAPPLLDVADPDAPVAIDAPDPEPVLFAASDAVVYRIDLDLDTATIIGTVMKGPTPIILYGLAFDGARLLGLDVGGVNLLILDRDTAAITATIPLGVTGLGGLTVIPSSDNAEQVPIVLAANGNTLYRIDTTTGQVTTVGTFGAGYTFFTDLAWVSGQGLIITLSTEDATHGVRIDPLTAATVSVVNQNFDNIRGLSGYRDTLWGFSIGGNVYSINVGTGDFLLELGSGPAWSEAAN